MDDGDENTPLLLRSRQRTVSHSTVISAHSIAHNVISLFQSESEPEIAVAQDEETVHSAVNTPFSRRLRRYFRPMWKAEYYGPLFHLVLVNFPYALMAFLCLFVGTLTGTTLLIALPLGAVICWFNLIGARSFARGELALQAHFHGPLTIQTPNPPMPIFTRRVIGDPSPSGNESGQQEAVNESSFLRNTYAMFTDPTSYQALFYFLVIKPSITLFLTLALWVAVPVSFALIIPAPAALRAISRIGIWQATIAVEGLSRPRL
ncbi:hypothetical protein BD410DRAFT_814112 [Rickenella mellea]|uniref:Sensor domain-containing protein n=1 Tax=Rickenella mellea TaxID=50990 RepID=A0A4Y7QAJ8_9AGAM|nr:hypothetical protein BD410DRAFT_814112 [Rickenella mellea]